MADKPFAEQTVVVTGGGTGIGRAAALAFADQGAAHVVITGRRPERLAEVAALHPAVRAVIADDTTAEGTEAVAAAVEQCGGTLDMFVHNAGVFRFSPLGAMDAATVREVMDINLIGPMLLTRPPAPGAARPRRQHRAVVSSRAGHNPTPVRSAYAASKAGMHSLTRTWPAELASHGIRVNAVAPGFVKTEAYAANGLTEDQVNGLFEHAKADIPLGAVGEVDDITPRITRLAEPAGALVTGQILTLDGGMGLA
ncbi:SDR family oxidoreductase [Streptomyces sp. 549]|uniref:SDR family NAD(P)-dependent oxidoreductase n=1 Tax=Streptomyces sp. 549 TaxID=3049076 RepID=UPI0024C2C28A|nr:SDR family oxidoreductase [Streptomyces sp. 549]MDK1473742.1 SDR family oxidoreductase [Streptomyces sp. 549]